jgi:alginate O-acetyltransferase complex protein AlgI
VLFNSYEFLLVFLPVVWLLFYGSARYSHRVALGVLTLASLVFYGWWNPKLLWLLLASAAGNFLVGRALARAVAQPAGQALASRLLTAAVVANLLLLCWYKYTNFLIGTANTLLHQQWPLVANLVLPLGISFFTFTQIAYLVDIRRGHAREADPLRYLLFVTYFPHLIAGPVIHHQQMMPQFALPSTFVPQRERLQSGLAIFALGLFKKVVIADHLALVANPVFDGAVHTAPTPAMAWVGALAYALQLYFDFSGYSDMAIGLSRLFNVELPINFNSPYRARNLIDFWRRWHITLSTFLRDYLYFALGGNRHGTVRRFVNLFTTMFLGGLWHGASWNFAFWGALHGLGLIVNHGWRSAVERWKLPDPFKLPGSGRLLTFVFVVIAWVPFRAADLATTQRVWSAMASTSGWHVPVDDPRALPWLLLCLAGAWWLPNSVDWVDGRGWQRLTWRPTVAWGAAMGLLAGVAVTFFTRNSPFLYYQF